MTDKYIGFKYRGKSLGMSASSDFKGFIENNGADLKFFNTPTFTNEFTPIAYGDKTIYTGNTKNNKTFNFLIHLVEISLADYKSFLNWLNLDSIIGVSGSNPLQGISIPARTIKTLEITATTITSIKPVSREIL
jgi:hypothetical protein